MSTRWREASKTAEEAGAFSLEGALSALAKNFLLVVVQKTGRRHQQQDDEENCHFRYPAPETLSEIVDGAPMHHADPLFPSLDMIAICALWSIVGRLHRHATCPAAKPCI